MKTERIRGALGVLLTAVALGAVARCNPTHAAGSAPGESSASTESRARAALAAGAALVDVRTAEEFARGHVRDAVNVPLAELGARADALAPGRTLVVYCHSGRRSAAATELLRARGRTVIDVGPMPSW